MEKPASTDYPIEELLRRRWSPRAFSDQPLEHEKLLSLFEAARWAPSSFNEQPWSFIVASKQNKEEHALLLSCLMEKNQHWAQRAPILMASVAKLDFERTGKTNRHAAHDVGLAMGNILVQATALGLVVHQMAGFYPEKVRQAYSVPEGFEPLTTIAIGYPAEVDVLPETFRAQELGPRTRKPLNSFVFQGRWGEPSRLIQT
ncbi:MAG TPA: nitroreductase family protein [Pyrinomonadaceae bacterium]|nr:nitroreductase family protein [Pyrinomonadaceae bacterium]